MIKFCIVCGKELTGKQRILCFDKECHRERKKCYDHEYRQDNVERIKERDREYQQNNRERIREQKHGYYQDNQEKIKGLRREYYWNNQENSREYYQNNREKTLENDHKRYRKSRGLPEDADLHKESSIEIIMREWLQENNIEFIPEYYIDLENLTWTHVDFYIPVLNICLYCDGDYWHSLLEVQERDIRINKALEEMGYRVIRLTETEILEGQQVLYAGCEICNI